MLTADEILQKHRDWLVHEERAQREQWEAARKKGLKALEAEGFAIRGLQPREDRSGFLGRTLIAYERTYGPDRGGFRLGPNDPVLLRHQANPDQTGLRAVI